MIYQGISHSFPHSRMPKSKGTDYLLELLLNNKSNEWPIADSLNERINFQDDAIWESALLVFLPLSLAAS